MKKKSLFLLASGVAAAALIGGTFASWAVTDNADPFSIKVSTGDVDQENVDYVTLEWGASQQMGNVSNLALATVRKAGVLDLRANTTATATPNGNLSFEVSGGTHIVAGLDVKVYRGDLTAESGVISAATISGATEVTFTAGVANLEVTKNAANLFTVAVNLKSSIDAAGLAEMAGETATLTFDWGVGTGAITARTLYATGFASTPRVYAWNGSSINHEWPGVEMTPVAGAAGYYTAQVNTQYTSVIFSDATNQSGDIVIASSFTDGKNLFTYDGTSGDAKGTFSVMGDVKEPEFYVIGDFTGVSPDYWTVDDDYKMTLKSGETDIYRLANVTLAAGAKFKVIENALSKQWYSNESTWDDCGFTLDSDGNIVVTAAGTYTIDFDLTPEYQNGNYIVLTKTA